MTAKENPFIAIAGRIDGAKGGGLTYRHESYG